MHRILVACVLALMSLAVPSEAYAHVLHAKQANPLVLFTNEHFSTLRVEQPRPTYSRGQHTDAQKIAIFDSLHTYAGTYDTFGSTLMTHAEVAKHPWMMEPSGANREFVFTMRATLHASQTVFARYLNVSTKLVQAWEGDRRTPEGPALVLLHLVAKQPDLLESVSHDAKPRPTRTGVPRRRAQHAPAR